MQAAVQAKMPRNQAFFGSFWAAGRYVDCIKDNVQIDDCMGSGHILIYAFEVLMEIYRERGYSDREAARSIVENNLFGLDIDDRCSQLAYFSVMMKARSYDRRFLDRRIRPHVYSIQESNSIVNYTNAAYLPDAQMNKIGEYLVEVFCHAKEIGSLRTVEAQDYNGYLDYLNYCKEQVEDDLEGYQWSITDAPKLESLARQAKVLSKKYITVCTNPPYLNKMEGHLKDFVVSEYKPYSGDLFSVFIYRNFGLCEQYGYSAFMTPFVWMFIKTYENLRKYIIDNKKITTLVQMEYSAFEEATVPICSFVLKNGKGEEPSLCFRLSEFKGGMDVQKKKVLEAIADPTCGYFYEAQQLNFVKIPGLPVAYWVSKTTADLFEGKSVSDYYNARVGLMTTDNDRFLRFFWEVSLDAICFGALCDEDAVNSKKKWFPHNKGGQYRKWMGNQEYVVDWENRGQRIKETAILKYPYLNGNPNFVVHDDGYYFRENISWSEITSANLSFRFFQKGFTFNVKGMSVFPVASNSLFELLAYANSCVANYFAKIINPTISFGVNSFGNLPYIETERSPYISKLAKENISLSSIDWDAFETSWNFARHPLVRPGSTVSAAFTAWQGECNTRFIQLKTNEEELNRIFIDIYGLQDELTPEVEDKDVTVRKADLGRDIRSFLSYAVGCMFGRYSLDTEGLAYAGGIFSDQWVVVSGKYYHRKVVEYYVGQELSRAYCLAKVDGSGNGGLPTGKTAAEGGIVFTFGSDEKGGGVDPFQYRRGTGKKFYEGICKLSVDCTGVEGGTGNAAYDLCSPEILDAITSEDCSGLVSRGWKDADRIDWKAIHYSLTTNHYCPDEDNVIPITDQKYLPDDIVERLCEFLDAVYGEETREENLDFIAKALGGKGTSSREVIRRYFLNDFFKDHCKIYQKRPIYWLFDSGRQNGFKALVYMHRWDKNSIGRVLVYLHKIQEKYEIEVRAIDALIEHMTDKRQEAVEERRKDHLLKQIAEIKEYDESLEHMTNEFIDIDLDDGVKVNYEKVQTDRNGMKYKILAPIK